MIESLLNIDPTIAFLIILLGIVSVVARYLVYFIENRNKTTLERLVHEVAEVHKRYSELISESRQLRQELLESNKILLEMRIEVHMIRKKLRIVEATLKQWLLNYPPDQQHIEEILRYIDDEDEKNPRR